MSESYVKASKSNTTFVGPDATKLFQASVIRRAINFYLETGMQVNRAYTPKAMREFASTISGKTYKRTELAQASDDLGAWIDAMKAAMPIEGQS